MEECHSWESNSHSGTPSYGTRRFIAVFRRARHWSLPRTRWIQSTCSHHIFLRFVIILSSCLRLGWFTAINEITRRVHIFSHISLLGSVNNLDNFKFGQSNLTIGRHNKIFLRNRSTS